MPRIFHVRINLDRVSADNDTLADDQERGEWLRGFLSAARGGQCRFADGSPGAMGWQQGAEALSYAESFSEAQAAKGKKSAEARKINHGSTTVQPRLSNGSTEPQPNLNLSNNPIIEQSKNQKTTSEEAMRAPVESSAADRIRPLIGHVRYRTADPERTAENQAELLALIDLYGIDRVMSVAMGEYAQTGEKIWPDRLGAAIADQILQDKRNRLPPPPAEPTWSNA